MMAKQAGGGSGGAQFNAEEPTVAGCSFAVCGVCIARQLPNAVAINHTIAYFSKGEDASDKGKR
jgi:hypothetical protein